MDDRNKEGGGGGTQLCKPEHHCSINGLWQVLPFGESKGSCRAEKNKTSINQVYILKSKHQLIKTRYAKAFKQEWKSFFLLNNPLLFVP